MVERANGLPLISFSINWQDVESCRPTTQRGIEMGRMLKDGNEALGGRGVYLES